MTPNQKLVLGILIGALAMWIYDHREEISFLSSNRTKLSGASKVLQGIKELGL
jgi:hypothetical protein